MITLTIAIILTLGVSAFCSLLEAMLLSTSTSEIEALKKVSPRKGEMMDYFKEDIEETSSAILALNTIANTLGAVVVGGLALQVFGDDSLFFFSIGMTFGILLFSEILPKNIGVIYSGGLIRKFVYPLYIVRFVMRPISLLCKKTVQLIVHPKEEDEEKHHEEIILLAEKRAQEGVLSKDESDIISNALSLDDIAVKDIMTPRTVITALEKNTTLSEVFEKYPNIPFARIPVYEEDMDHIVGLVRRRDMINTEKALTIEELMQPIQFIPENASGADALQHFLKNHQQLAVTVDEFGSTSGVVTMEDIFEHILGKEIFEEDDIAIDMRELAKMKKEQTDRNLKNSRHPFPEK